MDKLRTQHLPGKPVMLVKAVIGRMHDLIALFMLHQHADDRRLRQDGMDAACDALVARCLADVPGEAGAVVIMDGDDTLLDLAAALGRAVNGEVAALGVAAEQELPRKAQHGRGGIMRREALGRVCAMPTVSCRPRSPSWSAGSGSARPQSSFLHATTLKR